MVLLTRPGGAAGDFTGHSVELTGARTAPDTGAAVPFAAAGATTATGELTLAVPPRVTLVGTASFRVLAPDGTILATRAEAGPTLPQKVTIEVEPKVFGTTQPNTDPNAGAPTRLRGQVIDDAGKRSPRGSRSSSGAPPSRTRPTPTSGRCWSSPPTPAATSPAPTRSARSPPPTRPSGSTTTR